MLIDMKVLKNGKFMLVWVTGTKDIWHLFCDLIKSTLKIMGGFYPNYKCQGILNCDRPATQVDSFLVSVVNQMPF